MDDLGYVVLTTVGSDDEAAGIGRGAVESRFAACAHIVGPIRSFYHWDGAVQDDQEWQCWLKTTSDRVDELVGYIKTHHSYDLPAVVAMPITAGSEEYLSWVRAETHPQ